MRGRWTSIKTTRSYIDSAVAAAAEISASLSLSSSNEAFIVWHEEPDTRFFMVPKSPTPSAIAAVTPDGGSNWMAAEELEPLFGGSSILARAEEELEPSWEGRVLGPRIGWLQRTVAQWLSADSGAA